MDEILVQLCGLKRKLNLVVVDTEIALIIYLTQHLYPELYENLVLMPSIWHYKMHLIRNLVFDPVHMILPFLPYLTEFYGTQVEKFKIISASIEQKMRNFIAVQERQEKPQKVTAKDIGIKPKIVIDLHTDLEKLIEVMNEDVHNLGQDENVEEEIVDLQNPHNHYGDENADDNKIRDPEFKLYNDEQWKSIVQLCQEFTERGGRNNHVAFSYK